MELARTPSRRSLREAEQEEECQGIRAERRAVRAAAGAAAACPAASSLTSVGRRADPEHALDPLPVRCAIGGHRTTRERPQQIGELHHRRERLATIVGEEEAVSVPEEVATGVDPLRLAQALP